MQIEKINNKYRSQSVDHPCRDSITGLKNSLNLLQFVPKKKAKRSKLNHRICSKSTVMHTLPRLVWRLRGRLDTTRDPPCTRFSNILTLGEMWDSLTKSFPFSPAHCSGRTGGYLQMIRLMSLRNNRFEVGDCRKITNHSRGSQHEWKQNWKMSTCNRLDFRITWIFDRLCPKTSGAVVPRVPLPRPRIRQRCHETAHQVHKFIGGWCMVTTKSDNIYVRT